MHLEKRLLKVTNNPQQKRATIFVLLSWRRNCPIMSHYTLLLAHRALVRHFVLCTLQLITRT